MKILNKKNIVLSTIVASILFTGCGSNDIDDVYALPKSNIADYHVNVVDDAVHGATLQANECSGFEERTDGNYILTGCVSRPTAIIASGGYITIDDQNISMGFPLMLNTNMVEQSTSYTATPLTTLLATVDSYDELVNLKNQLGFDSVQDMFKDSNNTRDLQRTLNSFFIDAQNSGVDMNSFADFTKDFRQNIIDADKGSNGSDKIGLETIKNAKTKMKEDFENNKDKYLKKYGIVFSGFVTSTDYTKKDNSKDLLKSISRNYASDTDQIIFSGFIYDDIIGSSNKDKYNTDANITLTNLDTNSSVKFTQIDDNNNTTHVSSILANEYGKYILKINSNDIKEDDSYLLAGDIINKANKHINLNSILTGKEILSKFKAKLNTSDIPDMTITNVTTAKYAILKKQGIDIKDTDKVIAAKQNIETTHKDLLLDVATGLKTIIDGDANTTVDGEANTTTDTFNYISTLISSDGTEFTKSDDMNDDLFEQIKTTIQEDKTLKTQLDATKDSYTEFKVTSSMIKDKSIVFKISGDKYLSTLNIFDDNDKNTSTFTYTLSQKDSNASETTESGKLIINSNGNLDITNNEDNTTLKVSFSSLTMGNAFDAKGTFTGNISTPKGRIVDGNTTSLFDITNINTLDLTTVQAPMIEFTTDNLKNKMLFEVYKDANGKYQDRFLNFSDTKVVENEDVKQAIDNIANYNPLSNTLAKQYTISNGILSFDNHSYKIKNAYKSKIVCTNEENKTVELYYSEIDAAAAKEINNYSTENRFVDKYDESHWGSNQDDSNNPSNKIENWTLTANPMNDDKTDYSLSKIGTYLNHIDSSEVVGMKTQIRITQNNGDSDRQQAGVSARYWLPKCDGTQNQGQLRVSVFAKKGKIQYKLKLKDGKNSDAKSYDLTSAITMTTEKTFNTNYDIMILLVKNVVIIQVKNGETTHYQYAELDKIWEANSNILKGYGYPTSYRNNSFWAQLYDDGSGKLFENKSNSPISVKMNNFSLINGDNQYFDENNNSSSYKGGINESVCLITKPTPGTSNIAYTANDVIKVPQNISESGSSQYFEFGQAINADQYDSATSSDIANVITKDLYELSYDSSIAKATKADFSNGQLKAENIIMLGIRNSDKQEDEYLLEKGILCFRSETILQRGVTNIMNEVCSYIDKPVYLSLDIDVVDPSDAPGTGYTEANGISGSDFLYCLEELKNTGKLAMIDLVEVQPQKDVDEKTVKLAAKSLAVLKDY